MFLLNQVTDDLVVEELNWLPLDKRDVSKSISLALSVYYNIIHAHMGYLYPLGFVLFLFSL